MAGTRVDIIPPDFRKFEKAFSKRRKDFFDAALQLVVSDIVKGIKTDKSMIGGSFPALEPETIAKKGHSRPLIDKGLLSDEYTYKKLNQWRTDRAELTIKPLSRALAAGVRDTPRDQVGVELQIDGIDSKSGRKKFFFFGISQDASDKMNLVLNRIIEESLESINA